jgi:hypothetical protein
MNGKITEDVRTKAIRESSEAILAVYGDLDLGDLLYQICESLCMNDVRRIAFTHLIGDTILGLIPESELTDRISDGVGISKEKASEIQMKIDPFLSRVTSVSSETEHTLETNGISKVNGVSDDNRTVVSQPTSQPVHQNFSQPLSREEVLRALAPKRTMAEDINSARQVEEND